MRRVAAPGLLLALISFGVAPPSAGQEEQEETSSNEPRLGWSNATDFSLVATYGNSETQTLGFKNNLRYQWSTARYSMRVEGLRSFNADAKFVRVLFIPDDPTSLDVSEFTRLEDPEQKLDAEKYLIENTYTRELSDRLVWNVGFTWDRNSDANIIDRYVGFVGLGHIWWAGETRHFETSYGISYTDRHEETPDPEKDSDFPGARLASSFRHPLGGVTTVGNDSIYIGNLTDFGDWSVDSSSWLAVSMNRHLALRVSVQWLYNSRPALEEIDVVLSQPEFEIDFGTVRIRKETLDTILNTSVVITF